MKKNTTGTLYGKYSHGNQYSFYFSNEQKKIRKKVVKAKKIFLLLAVVKDE